MRLLCCTLLIALHTAYGQSSGGAISGTISDPGSAVIAGAEIVIENTSTHDTRRLASSSSGFYNAPNLPPGTYEVRVSAPGFASLVRKDVEVQVGSEAVVNAQLKVGAASDRPERQAGVTTELTSSPVEARRVPEPGIPC